MHADSEQIAVGVIGVGGMGARHADNMHAKVVGARVAGIMDADLTRAKKAAARCGSAKVFRDPLELIRDDGVEAIVIAAPDHLHAELTLECIRNEKPVLCEKPLATSVTDAREIVEAEVKLGRKLIQVGFMRRYDPQHLDIKNAIASGVIGRPILFKGWHREPETSVGVTSEYIIFSGAIHDLDAARWLLGQEIEEVYVRGANTDPALGTDTCDMQLIQLSLSGGCLGTIEVYATAGYGYEVGAELVGEKGTVQTAPTGRTVIRQDRALCRRIVSDWFERFETAYAVEIEQWTKLLREGQYLTGSNAWDGYASVVAAEACVASLQSRSPQRLSSLRRPTLYEQS